LLWGFLSGGTERHPAYLSWDDLAARKVLLRGELPARERIIVLDEIHKFARWRNLVKGFYDTHKSTISFLVTGSARLDYYRKGGDSLQGRYHFFRLHPFSLREMSSTPKPEDVDLLVRFGGFPEPLLRGSERAWRRWQRERVDRVMNEDIRDLEHVREVSMLEALAEAPNNAICEMLMEYDVGSSPHALVPGRAACEQFLPGDARARGFNLRP